MNSLFCICLSRSVICNDPEISLVPASFPADTSKLRIEKTAIKRIPSEAFNYLSNLEFLWMSFNVLASLNTDSFRGLYSLEELRLDGNSLTTFPWESLMDMPSLRLLDLHNNQLSSVPPEATLYIKNLTYLDLSSNNLLTLPSEVLATWLTIKAVQGLESSKMILGLHDNPWLCDCRLYDLVQFQKSPSLSVAFIDTRLRCADPESLSGVLFSDAELRRCQSPRVHTAVARVRSAVGNNVLLRCGTIGVPIPELAWRRADGKLLNGTVQQENSKEGIVWSILSVPAVSFYDSGKYICKATNYAGSAEAVISLIISDSPKMENQTANAKKVKGKKPGPVVKAAYQEKLIARYVSPRPTPASALVAPVGLVPKTKYIACVCVKGLIPKKEQCVIFSTDAAASANGTQKLINVVVITVACVIAVPLTVIVCCGALKRKIQKFLGKKSKDIPDSYVTFETLSPSTKAKGLEGEYLNRLNPEESNRLLSARSSLDSESTAKIEGQPNEYFC
uniref:Leucine-rich repeat, immunoglobulin-like and transmembrane domains 1a n=1 Tax=Astyanax mexicanus TaxID=7994 RepID=A0A8B9LBH9_ASTMX